jgi:hypothetical protein
MSTVVPARSGSLGRLATEPIAYSGHRPSEAVIRTVGLRDVKEERVGWAWVHSVAVAERRDDRQAFGEHDPGIHCEIDQQGVTGMNDLTELGIDEGSAMGRRFRRTRIGVYF